MMCLSRSPFVLLSESSLKMSPRPAGEIGALERPRILINKLEQVLHNGHHWFKYTIYGERMSIDGSCTAKFCSKCGARGQCIASKQSVEYVRRRYLCTLKGCGHRWTTAEFLVDDSSKLSRDKFSPFLEYKGDVAVRAALERLSDVIAELK